MRGCRDFRIAGNDISNFSLADGIVYVGASERGVITGNVIHCIGKPRYKYAVIIPGGQNAPRGLHFSNNLFHPGTEAVANTELPP